MCEIKSSKQNECSMFICLTQLQRIPPPLQPFIKCALWIWEEGTRENEKGFCFSSFTTVEGRAKSSNSPSNGPKTPVHIRGQEGDHQSHVGNATFTSPLALHTWDTFDIMLGHVVLWRSQRPVEIVKQQAHHEALPSDKQEGGRWDTLFLQLRLQEQLGHWDLHCNLQSWDRFVNNKKKTNKVSTSVWTWGWVTTFQQTQLIAH